MKIAFIAQRYGTEILGGSEYHCRLIAERLAQRHQVDVLTTCAREYTTWQNEYPEGTDRVRGVTVRRFACSQVRNLPEFNKYSDWIFENRHTPQDEMEWLKRQGPWSPGLISYIESHHQNYDILIYFTYLYAPTVLGMKIAPAKSLLVPTAHDEPALGLKIYEQVFSSVAGIVWNTESERRMITSRFHLRALVEDVVGCGVDMESGTDTGGEDTSAAMMVSPITVREPLPAHIEGPANAFRRRHRMHGPFLLYGGRIDPGKGCEELLEYFQAFLHDGGDASLMLMGVKLMPLPDDPRVRFAGLLPDQERLHALQAATVVVVPSPYESLSLLALEAFAVGTPVLANARAEVLVDHCRQSNAGLFYSDRYEFAEALKMLLKDPDLRHQMGENGKAYVEKNYRWDVIISKYERMFARLRGGSGAAVAEHRDHGGEHRGRDSRDHRDQRGGRDHRDSRGGRDRDRGRDSRGRDSKSHGEKSQRDVKPQGEGSQGQKKPQGDPQNAHRTEGSRRKDDRGRRRR
jgi:glycosyltransferase involved in cell wall biosynthesis